MANRRTMQRPDVFDTLPSDPDYGMDAHEEARRNVPTVDLADEDERDWDTPPPPLAPPTGMGDDMEALFTQTALRYGTTPDRMKTIYQTDEGAFYALVAKNGAEAEAVVPATKPMRRERDIPKSIGAIGTEWWQVYIGPEDEAQWTGMFPPLDPPDAKGRRWQPKAVKVQLQYVRLKRDLEGFTFHPKGPFHPPGWLPCELPSATGGRCPYLAYGDGDPDDEELITAEERAALEAAAEFQLEEHQAAKHPRMYRAKQAALARRSGDNLNQMIAALSAQGRSADVNTAAMADALRLLASALPQLARPAGTEG